MISEGPIGPASRDGTRHYTVIKSLSRLLRSSNTKHKCKQYFCTNCLQSFTLESRRDEHQVYCEDNETVRVEMPSKGSVIEFYDGQNQFKVPFMMYADFEAILEPMQGSRCGPCESLQDLQAERIPDPKGPFILKILVNTFPLDFVFTAILHMGRLRIH